MTAEDWGDGVAIGALLAAGGMLIKQAAELHGWRRVLLALALITALLYGSARVAQHVRLERERGDAVERER